MVNLKNHIFGYSIFCSIARLASSNTVICNIAKIVINAIHAVVYMRPIAVAWPLNECGFSSAIKAVLLCYRNELVKRKFEFNASIRRISDVIFKQSVLCVGTTGMSSICVTHVGRRPLLKREAPARGGAPGLNSANPCFKLFSAVTLACRKVMMSVFRVPLCYPDDGEARKPHASVFGFCTFSYQIAPLELASIINQIKQWDKFNGKPLRGLTLRREREYQLCITP